MKEKILLYEKRDFGEVLNVSFFFIKQNIKILGQIVLYICMPFILLTTIINTLILDTLYQFMDKVLKKTINFNFQDLDWLSLVGLSVISIIAIILLYAALMAATYQFFHLYQNTENIEEITFNKISKNIFYKFSTLFFTQLSITFIVLIGFLLLLIPGLYWLFLFALLSPARYFENITLRKSLGRCVELYKVDGSFNWGKYFQSVGLLIIVYVISVASGSVLTSIYQMFGYQPFDPKSIEKGGGFEVSWVVILITSLISQIHATIVSIMTAIVIAFQYFNLVEQSDGKSLEIDVENFGK